MIHYAQNSFLAKWAGLAASTNCNYLFLIFPPILRATVHCRRWLQPLTVKLFSVCVTFSNFLIFLEVSQLCLLPWIFNLFLHQNICTQKMSKWRKQYFIVVMLFVIRSAMYWIWLMPKNYHQSPEKRGEEKRGEDWDIKSCTPMKVYGTILQGKDYWRQKTYRGSDERKKIRHTAWWTKSAVVLKKLNFLWTFSSLQ